MYLGFLTGLDAQSLGEFVKTVKWARENGFDCVSVIAADMQEVKARAGEIGRMLEAEGVFISALGSHANHLDADLGKREKAKSRLTDAVDVCAQLNIPCTVTYLGSPAGMFWYGIPLGTFNPQGPAKALEDGVRILAESFAQLVDYADAHGVKIGLDTAPRGGGVGNLAHNPEMWELIFKTVSSRALALSLDPSHLVWLQIGPVPDVIRRFGERICHMEAKDAEISYTRLASQGILGNSWWRYRLPGFGAIDWAATISALMDIGYDYSIDIENEDPVFPGLTGVLLARNHLMRFLEPRR